MSHASVKTRKVASARRTATVQARRAVRTKAKIDFRQAAAGAKITILVG